MEAYRAIGEQATYLVLWNGRVVYHTQRAIGANSESLREAAHNASGTTETIYECALCSAYFTGLFGDHLVAAHDATQRDVWSHDGQNVWQGVAVLPDGRWHNLTHLHGFKELHEASESL